MPSCAEHLQQCDTATSVQLILETEDPSKYADWIVITAFYQALHWVDAFFALEGYDPQRHGPTYKNCKNKRILIDLGRNGSVREKLKPIRDNYSALYKASITARYEEESYKDRSNDVKKLLETDLKSIKNHISPLV